MTVSVEIRKSSGAPPGRPEPPAVVRRRRFVPDRCPPATTPANSNKRSNSDVQIGRGTPGATVRARMPSVARSAPSEMTGKMPASLQTGSMVDQS